MFSLSMNLFCNIHLSQLFVICREDKWLFNEKSLSAITFLYLCMEMGNDHILKIYLCTWLNLINIYGT